MPATEVAQVVGEVRDFAQDPLKETRVIDSVEVGQHVRQGDVYIQRVAAPAAWKETKNRQLAPGTTMGSRHTVDESVKVLANPAGAKVERTTDNRFPFRCNGPQIVSEDRFTVSHPEHADFSLPAGTYQVSFQCDPQSMQRVQD
jgi:hypothetical protein